MIGRCTHVVDCRETSGMGKGGSLAQRGTFAECGTDVCAEIGRASCRERV